MDTPSSRIVDMGTEFGVTVSDDGSEVTVFSGRVALWSGSRSSAPLELTANQTMVVDRATNQARRVAKRQGYVQSMRDARAGIIQLDFGATGMSTNMEFTHELDESANRTSTLGNTVWNAIVPGESGSDRPAGTTQRFANLKDANGTSTNVAVHLTWSNQPGVDFSRAWNLFPPVRDGDHIGLRGDNNDIFNTIKLSNLKPGATYDVTVWSASRTGFRVNGGEPVVLSGKRNMTSALDNAASHTFGSAVANDRGQLVIDWGRIGTNHSREDVWTTVTALAVAPTRDVN
ncbi:MAG: FecR family protein [Pirellulales bacterium]|nr:FecR family protein [Pirellulales bacterium]